MQRLIKFETVSLGADHTGPHILDMTGRCAFAICLKGVFEIKMLNERYHADRGCMFACMPFVNIEVTHDDSPCEILLGYISLADIPAMINRWINTGNLIAIQNSPLIKVADTQLCRLLNLINSHIIEERRSGDEPHTRISQQIQNDIIEFESKLIVAHVLKLFFDNLRLKPGGSTHRDVIFQQFMIALYDKHREHRDVRFYAMRSGVSLKYFSTVIKELSGESPSDWIETVVVGEAKTMLNNMERSIKDIATVLNFPDAPTFTKYFVRVTGMTPKKYRKSIQ